MGNDKNILKLMLEQQSKYNNVIRAANPLSKEEWTSTYLLGLISEIDDVLDAIHWKRHRKQDIKFIETNIGHQLADLTKYVLSLWEIWGFSAEQIQIYVDRKSKFLEHMLTQENILLTNEQILIVDLDGILVNLHDTIIEWADQDTSDIPQSTLLMDQVLSMRYPDYAVMKRGLEEAGMYVFAQEYKDATQYVKKLQSIGFKVIFVTARPFPEIQSVWFDTYSWLSLHGLNPEYLLFVKDKRILLADELAVNNKVIILDDDPVWIMRAATSGIPVIARRFPYNEFLEGELNNVAFVDNFMEDPKYGVRTTIKQHEARAKIRGS